jgi:cystathionine beta-lyase/cystathionine gamma-synthase
MIRLSVGIEDIEDIKNDFEIGFRATKKPTLVSNQ